MATFTELLPYNSNGLQENYAIVNGAEQSHTDTSAEFDWTPSSGPDAGETVVLTLTGSGFGTSIATPDSSWLITEISASVNGQTVWTMAGLDGLPSGPLNGAQLVAALASDHGDGAAFFLFHGDDTIQGSPTGNDELSGFSGNDLIKAGGGQDRLDAGGGNDTLVGGSGHDVFVFTHTIGSGDIATIQNFSVARDHIELSSNIFTNVADFGVLPAAEFHIGTHATSAAERIVYNPNTGALYYDPHGSSGAQEEFAVLHPHLALTAANFLIF